MHIHTHTRREIPININHFQLGGICNADYFLFIALEPRVGTYFGLLLKRYQNETVSNIFANVLAVDHKFSIRFYHQIYEYHKNTNLKSFVDIPSTTQLLPRANANPDCASIPSAPAFATTIYSWDNNLLKRQIRWINSTGLRIRLNSPSKNAIGSSIRYGENNTSLYLFPKFASFFSFSRWSRNTYSQFSRKLFNQFENCLRNMMKVLQFYKTGAA